MNAKERTEYHLIHFRRRYTRYRAAEGGKGWIFVNKADAQSARDELRAIARGHPYKVTLQLRVVQSNTFALPVYALTIRGTS